MAAVAERRVAATLAGAEEHLAAGLRFEFDRAETRNLVGAVAERLRLRAPASAPPVALAGLDVACDRPPPADLGFGHAHEFAPPPSVASQASPQPLANSRTR